MRKLGTRLREELRLDQITGPSRQSITTAFLGPTDHRDPRVKATCEAGSVTLVWDDALDQRENHAMAAITLAHRLDWCVPAAFADEWAMGSIRGGGYVFVNVGVNRKWKGDQHA